MRKLARSAERAVLLARWQKGAFKNEAPGATFRIVGIDAANEDHCGVQQCEEWLLILEIQNL